MEPVKTTVGDVVEEWQNARITLSNGKSGWFAGRAIVTEEELKSGEVKVLTISMEPPRKLDPDITVIALPTQI